MSSEMNIDFSNISISENITDNLNNKSQIRCVAIGDPHFKTKNKREMELMVTKSIEFIRKIKPDFIINLGDTLDTHEKIHVVPLTQSINWMEELSTIAPLYVIIGNHDRPNNSDFLSDLHPFNGMKDNKNIKIVDCVKTCEINDFKFMFVPYVPPGKFNEAISTIEDNINNIKDYTCVWSHQEFYGAKMGAIISKDGDKWPLHNPIVVSGHIHDYQRPQENMIYTGTPIQHAFGDHARKTISLFTFSRDDNTIKSDYNKNNRNNTVIVNGIRCTEERIDLGLPKKRIFRLTTQEVLTWQPPQNSLIKLIILGTNAELKATMKLSLIKQWEKSGIKIDTKTTDDHAGISDTVNDVLEREIHFKQKLKQRVEHDPRMNKLYDMIFTQLQ